MALQIVDNVRQELIKLVPSAVFDEITCFVFYDNHPLDEKFIDVTICTSGGEIIEYFKREKVCSLLLETTTKPSEIRIIRNGNCDLFYMVVIGDEIVLLSRKQELSLHRRISNVDKFSIEDQACRGQVCLKIKCKDDAVPLIFDDNFENLGDRAMFLSGIHADDSLPIITQLMRKLTEAKYSVKCNEKTLSELLSLRQKSALASYQQICPNSDDSVFRFKSKEVVIKEFAPDIKTQTPWVKLCNKKIIIVLNLSYVSNIPLEDVHILLHSTSKSSIIYTTRLFKKIETVPFWIEKRTRLIKNENEIAVTAVVDFEEINNDLTHRIEFNGVLFYSKCGQEYLVPLDQVFISGEEIAGNEFDALTSTNLDENTCLAILASTIETDMLFRHIRKNEDPSIDMPSLFCTHFHMETVLNSKHVVLYRMSPYHALNGVMLKFEKDDADTDVYDVSVYTRSPSQVITLMYLVHTTIPHRILITAKNQKITAKKDELSRYNEPLIMESSKFNFEGYRSAIANQSNILLEYLDVCMMKMSGGKNADKIGKEIDLLSPGLSAYNEFRQNMLNEASKGVKSLLETENEPEEMMIE